MLSKRQREFVEHLLVSEETGMSDREWAELIGVSPATCVAWKRKPDVIDALEAAKKEYDAGASVLGRKTFTWALEEAVVNYRKSLAADDMREARQWWLTIKNLTEPEARSSARVEYGSWSDEDLQAEVFRRGLTPTEAALAELQGVSE